MSIFALTSDIYPLIYRHLNQIDFGHLINTCRFFRDEPKLNFLLKEIYRILTRKASIFVLSPAIIRNVSGVGICINRDFLEDSNNIAKFSLEEYRKLVKAPEWILPPNYFYGISPEIVDDEYVGVLDDENICEKLNELGISDYDIVILGNYETRIYNGCLYSLEMMENKISMSNLDFKITPPQYYHTPEEISGNSLFDVDIVLYNLFSYDDFVPYNLFSYDDFVEVPFICVGNHNLAGLIKYNFKRPYELWFELARQYLEKHDTSWRWE